MSDFTDDEVRRLMRDLPPADVPSEAAEAPEAERWRQALLAGAEIERARMAWARIPEQGSDGFSRDDWFEAFLCKVRTWMMWAGPRGIRWVEQADRSVVAERPDGTTAGYAHGGDLDPLFADSRLTAGVEVLLRARDAADAENRRLADDGWARKIGLL